MTTLASAAASRAVVRTRARSGRGVRVLLVSVALGFLALFLVAPVIALLSEAFAEGPAAYLRALDDAETWAAVRLSLVVTAIAVPLNAVFGVAAAWAITKHEFRGKAVLVSLIDLPFSVSPVVAGLVLVLVFGRAGVLGPLLADHGVKVIFAVPGIVLATLFVTFPMVARELIPLMTAQGREEELAARVLGASGWQILRRVTLPNIKWGLLYGVVVATARALGEFGAVSVVSGHIRGVTTTLPLAVEIRYNEYDFVGAFASASLLALMAVVTLAAKLWVERRGKLEERRGLGTKAADADGPDGD